MHRNHSGTAHGWGVSCCAQINAHPHVPVPAVGPESHWHWVTKSEWPTASFSQPRNKKAQQEQHWYHKASAQRRKDAGSIPQTGHLRNVTPPAISGADRRCTWRGTAKGLLCGSLCDQINPTGDMFGRLKHCVQIVYEQLLHMVNHKTKRINNCERVVLPHAHETMSASKGMQKCSGFTERDKNMCVRNSHTAVFGVHDTHWNEHGYVERKPWNPNTKPGALIHFHVSSESSILVSSSLLWPKIPIPSASRWNHGSDRSTPCVGDGWCVEAIYCMHIYIYKYICITYLELTCFHGKKHVLAPNQGSIKF